MMGTVMPCETRPATMSGTAAAAASLFTVTRTSSLPARARSATCATVAAMSAVSVLVIDWTTTGCSAPSATPPTLTVGVRRRETAVISAPESGEAELRDEAIPLGRGHRAITAQRLERGEDFGAGARNAPIAKLADHAGEFVLVFGRRQFAGLVRGGNLGELLRRAGGGDRRKRGVGHCGSLEEPKANRGRWKSRSETALPMPPSPSLASSSSSFPATATASGSRTRFRCGAPVAT